MDMAVLLIRHGFLRVNLRKFVNALLFAFVLICSFFFVYLSSLFMKDHFKIENSKPGGGQLFVDIKKQYNGFCPLISPFLGKEIYEMFRLFPFTGLK
jgi:hypothetical protein